MKVSLDLEKLYESDYIQWLETTVKALKSRHLDEVDYDHLIEELEALVRSEKRRVKSLLEQIIRHLLLYQYWTTEQEYNANHWEAEILSFRNQINEDLTTNLRNYLQENLEAIYGDARDYVKAKTRLTTLPAKSPYSLSQLLDKSYL